MQTALGISPATSAMDIDRQAEMIAARLDIADLKDPEKLDKFLARFASLWELQNGRRRRHRHLARVLFSQPLELGIGADLLASLQNLKLGGS